MGSLEYFRDEQRFSREEVEGLAERLVSVKPPLTEPEQRLLLAVFSAAADHVTVTGEPPQPEPTDLKEKILRAFIPDADEFKSGADTLIITYRIGSDPWKHRIGSDPKTPLD